MQRFEELLDGFFYRPDEDAGRLFDIGPVPDAPAPIEDEPPEEFLAFLLAKELYAVPIGDVREIVKVPVLTEVPRALPELLGVINLRGAVLPVYDLKLLTRLSETPAPVAGPDAKLDELPRSARILIIHDLQGDAGVLVDEVQEVVKLRPSTIEAPPRGISGGERSAITGLGRRRDQLFILLDLAQTLP